MKQDGDWSDNGNLSNKAALGGTFDVKYLEKSSNTAKLLITGRMDSAVRKITIELKRESGSGFNDAVYLGGKISLSGKYTSLNVNGSAVEKGDDVPKVDYAYFKKIADYVVKNMTFKKNKTYNGIYYVTKNVKIEKNVTINGTIIAEKYITIQATNQLTRINAPKPLPALIAKGNITVNRNSKLLVNGVIHADGKITIAGSSTSVVMNGALSAKGNLVCKNNSNTTLNYNSLPITGFTWNNAGGTVTTKNWQEAS